MTPHDSTRCAVCAYEGGDHAYWCEAHLRPSPSAGVGAVDENPPVSAIVCTQCEKIIGYYLHDSEAQRRAAFELGKAHGLECDKNPLVIEVRQLREQVATLEKLRQRDAEIRAAGHAAEIEAIKIKLMGVGARCEFCPQGSGNDCPGCPAVARATPAEGRAVAWGLRDKLTGSINAARGQLGNAEEIRDQLLAQRVDVEVIPLYAAPVPSGVTEAMVKQGRHAKRCELHAGWHKSDEALDCEDCVRAILTAALAAAEQGGG